jgi:hypothetical protein
MRPPDPLPSGRSAVEGVATGSRRGWELAADGLNPKGGTCCDLAEGAAPRRRGSHAVEEGESGGDAEEIWVARVLFADVAEF